MKSVRSWLMGGMFLVLFQAPVYALQASDVSDPTDSEQISEIPVEPSSDPNSPHWVDSSHEYATNRAQALAQWMDDFFGAPVRDAERADTFVRAIFLDDWDERDGHDPKVRLRGQISLPKISERVDLVFSGEESEQTLTEEERAQENDVGVRFNFRDSRRTRLDATLSLRSGPAVLPGVRFRYQQPITDNSWARFTQRLQYHSEDGYRSLSNFDVNRILDDKSLLRWNGRVRFREEKDFWDWNTGITYRRWLDDHEKFPSALEYFVAVSGRDQPENYETNYRLGVLYRKQFFRQFLYYEIEPSYNWRRDLYEEKREGVLGVVLRLEVMLDRKLVGGR
ncbi:hypothetical protein R0135_08830 [Congregibacter variabilis]|uniref:Uncharacterized protein n=1 Tax=Congregibacter variabilis TaxID=3081200 RepID=A0ABZ0HYS9_9GAMM|nr:hypothetical protein R0135_08830 [Congregibacter sp. IMCC43200]